MGIPKRDLSVKQCFVSHSSIQGRQKGISFQPLSKCTREFLFSLVESALINHSLFFHRLRWTREMKRDGQGFLHWAMSEVFNRFVWQWTDQIERQLISSENPRTSKKKRQVLMIFFFTDWRRSTRELFFSRLSSQASLFWERMCVCD